MAEPNALLDELGIEHPIIQAPMAGVSTPELAAAVSNAGGLGSIGIGAETLDGARKMIAATHALTRRSFNVNVFCHERAVSRPRIEAAWIKRLEAEFERFGSEPPVVLHEIYKTFKDDADMTALLVESRPAVVSFHFGLPNDEQIAALRDAGITLLASATNLREARAIVSAGIDVLIAQGYEAGGHRGVFDPSAPDDRIGTIALTRLFSRTFQVPVVAAGGIMDGAGIAAVLRLGASAAQLGTAFVACTESSADLGYKAALTSAAALHTVMTRAISGRPARCLANLFTRLAADVEAAEIPDYPIAYDLGKALQAAAKRRSEYGFGYG